MSLVAMYLHNAFLNKKKERFDIILEPLQAFIQLALLSFSPIDSKLNIYDNILYIQIPGWKQSIIRTYYSDSKNDLFFLFNVIKRFNKFYKHLESITNENTNLFVLLRQLSNKGIDNLLQTYKQTDNPALLHTLNIYKDILNRLDNQNITTNNNNNENNNNNNNNDNKSISNLFSKQLSIQQNQASPSSTQSLSPKTAPSIAPSISPSISLSQLPSIAQSTTVEIDNVFINITKLYTEYDLLIIFNTLQLLQTNPNNYIEYMEGLNRILEPINNQIKNWIVDNIVY